MALLLVGGRAPFLPVSYIEQLHLQAAHKDVRTDDVLVITRDAAGAHRRALWSVKHDLRFTKGDATFRDVLQKAWKDFQDSSRFDAERDAIVLATTPLTESQKHFRTVLEWSRASANGADLVGRLSRKGYAPPGAEDFLASVRQSYPADKHPVSDDELWKFLRVFYVATFDFDSPGSLEESRFKTMLALATSQKLQATGETVWNSVYKYVAELNPRAGSFTRANLPPEITQVCVPLQTYFQSGAIARIEEHSKAHLLRVRRVIRSNISLPREQTLGRIVQCVAETQFTLVTGVAGIGKSAAAVAALQTAQSGDPLFVFQAMEFARQHLDQVFADIRVNERLSEVSALFAVHRRKLLLIESVEKLLEAPERDAFAMFLEELKTDETWRIILTCRIHAVKMVGEAFLAPAGISFQEVEVGELSDTEFDTVLTQIPSLRIVASIPRVRRLLRNPWYLDKASTVEWNSEAARPNDERQLRDVLWRHVVKRDDYQASGLHRQRDACFRSVAVRRAKTLRAFVPVESQHEPATQSLIADELLVEERTTGHVAPAHDVLEDWALIRWIGEQFTASNYTPLEFFATLGHELPIRRSYRHWLRESLNDDADGLVNKFVVETIASTGIESYWRDETLVSILLSDVAAQFIRTHELFLVSNEKQQLFRLIHLLRIACKAPNAFLGASEDKLLAAFGDYHLVPVGEAWPEVLRLISRNIERFEIREMPLILGLLHDWKSAIHWQNPTPEAGREAGLIALHYWKVAESRQVWERDRWDQIVELVLASPEAIASELTELVNSLPREHRHHSGYDQLKEAILMSVNGWAICRFLPTVVVELARRVWGLTEVPEVRPRRHHRHGQEIDDEFGLLHSSRLDYFPESAFQGPFLALLRWHPNRGLGLVLELVNVAVERLATNQQQRGAPLQRVTIRNPDGTMKEQWAEAELWTLYRGTGSGPNVMQCALMALEKWLLELADAAPDTLEAWVKHILQQSDNAAITAVVASVTMAFPERLTAVALSLLRVPTFFAFDRIRWVGDQTPMSAIPSMLGSIPQHAIYECERRESDKLPHRLAHFEWLMTKLQLSDAREAVWEIIDERKAALAAIRDQDDRHKIERLRLHRTDVRQFRSSRKLEDGRVLFEAGPPEPDVAAMVEKATPRITASNKAAELLVWGLAVFERRDSDKQDPTRWKEMFKRARTATRDYERDEGLKITYGGGPAYVAAVCVRDHWCDLALAERSWCRKYLTSVVSDEKDKGDQLMHITAGPMGGAMPAAGVLPLLLVDAKAKEIAAVRHAIADSITHEVQQVQESAARGLRQHGWKSDPVGTLACVSGLIALAEIRRRHNASTQRARWAGGYTHEKVETPSVAPVRARIASCSSVPPIKLIRLSLSDPPSCQVWPLILCIFADQQNDPVARPFFLHAARALAKGFKMERSHSEWRNYEAEASITKLLAQFVIVCNPEDAASYWCPFMSSIPTYAEEVAKVFEQLIYAQDLQGQQSSETFWHLWGITSDRVLSVPNRVEIMGQKHSQLAQLASVLLLDRIYWKKTAADWHPIHGHEKELQDFFVATGNAIAVFQSFVRTLDSVGKTLLLPGALKSLANCLSRGDAKRMLDRDCQFHLIRILTPIVYARTAMARSAPDIRDAILLILNQMVEAGSSAAFRMREFFVTPVSPLATSTSFIV